MSYVTDGTLTTDKRTVDDTTTWDTQTDWEAYQSKTDTEIINGAVQLREITVPASQDLLARYDATALSLNDGDSVSTFPDETGNGHDLTTGTAPRFRTSIINGNPVVSFDGADDTLSTLFSDIAQPFHIFAVYLWQGSTTPSSDSRLHSSDDVNNAGDVLSSSSSNSFEMYSGSGLQGSALDNSPHIFGFLFNGASSTFRTDGTQSNSGDAGTNALSGFRLGSIDGTQQFSQVDVGEVLIYPQDKSGIQADVEQYLSDKWGITLS